MEPVFLATSHKRSRSIDQMGRSGSFHIFNMP
jgi:hypothetical protein